jgi:hypothetical protein
MHDLRLKMTLSENRIFANACLTYSDVPFHAVEKMRFSEDELQQNDELFDRLLEERRQLKSASGAESDMIEVKFSSVELDLLIDVLDTVLQEHVGFDYDLGLHVAPRQNVEAATAKLHAARLKQTA